MQRPKTLEERIAEGRDAIRLIDQHGLTMSAVARRKGVPFNSIKQWVAKARAHDGR